jgi:ACS family D-galactonate transporter-like MFS transporter
MPKVELKPRALHWFGLVLLVISVCINYADRGNLGVAAKSLERELHLGQAELGTLLGAFSITYSVSQFFAGKLIDRWNVNWLYAAAFFLWSAATGATGLTSTFAEIFLLRLVLGVAESIAYPAYAQMIVTTFPEGLRGTANGLIDAGSKLGPALGVLLGVEMIARFSWRGMFFIIGAGSLIWLIPWCLVAHKLPGKRIQGHPESGWSASYRQLLSSRAMWGTAIGLFGGNYAWFFFLNWLPYYFENDRHYTHDTLAIMGSLPFWAIAASSTFFGLFADWLIRRGGHAGNIRRFFVCTGLSGCGVLMLAAILTPDALWSNIWLLSASVSMGAWSSNHWAYSQLLAGPETAAKWTGIQNGIGNFAGLIGPMVSGFALKATHTFFAAFAITCAVLFIGVLAYWVLVGAPVQVFHRDPVAPRRPANVY